MLYLDSNLLGPVSGEALRHAVAANTELRTLSLTGNALLALSASAISSAAQHASAPTAAFGRTRASSNSGGGGGGVIGGRSTGGGGGGGGGGGVGGVGGGGVVGAIQALLRPASVAARRAAQCPALASEARQLRAALEAARASAAEAQRQVAAKDAALVALQVRGPGSLGPGVAWGYLFLGSGLLGGASF